VVLGSERDLRLIALLTIFGGNAQALVERWGIQDLALARRPPGIL
jgi:hypothetical protein